MKSRRLEYFLDTGEPFNEAVHRLAKTHTASEAARILGYANCHTLLRSLKRYGIEVEFQKRGKHYTLNGVRDTVAAHAERAGLPIGVVHKRIEAWGLCDRVFLEPNRHRTGQRYEMDGESLSVREWAERLGVTANLLYGRIDRWGWCDRVLERPRPRTGRRFGQPSKPQTTTKKELHSE